MARLHVDHKDLVKFANDRVNLPKEKADEYRAQARRLADKLENYISEHPTFSIKRIMLSGSLAKGTALRSLNDVDMACYISGAEAPTDVKELLEYVAERLRTAFPNFKPDQVKPQTYSITVSFMGSGLDVDIVPILYYGDKEWKGDLVSQENGSYLETSIPMHLEFIRKRKSANHTHFSQVVRLIKFWTRKEKRERSDFRFKSFMVELVLAHLVDNGQDLSDYPEALQSFFTYLASSELREKIIFTDYYSRNSVGNFKEPCQIIDPVNTSNNVAGLYTEMNLKVIAEAALDAGDAIDAALAATTKEKTVYYWQKVFGSTFDV
ncbi:CBASS oligonucleotide cyclase [Arsukibacterium indicum]|uniref:Nucleotidyltransferase n=1 Tax=Arsukibacterium indicum TaxID=2848612 RepID=A0ABS6MKW8_9GAMM|nr:CBASS oligonucleotide cyclase [Arsukibacterium indicum]MBV2128936.1 nucleotidyltransferase [Arsukibacterium indicum]